MRGAPSHLFVRARSALPGWRWPLALAPGVVLILCAALVFFIARLDWNAARGLIERRFAERTGRELVIGGNLDVQLGWRPRVVAHDVRVANPDWARRPDFVTARRVTLTLSVPALLRGAIGLHEIELAEPRLALEQRDGLRTWAFGRQGTGPPPEIRRLRIDDGVIEYLDVATDTAITAEISSRGEAAHDDLRVSARGKHRGELFRLQGTGPSLLRLADRSVPYRLEATVHAGKTRAHLDGTVTGLPSPSALDVQLALSGDDMSHLRRLLGIGAPPTPPYALRGRLRHEGGKWSLDGVQGTIGDSDIAGELAYTATPRPHLVLTIVSERLDFDDLGPLIGAPPKTTAGETASSEQRREAQRMKQRNQALPDKPFDFRRWQRMDVDVSLVGKRVLHPPALPIQTLEATLRIRDGVLRLVPLRLRAAGGEIVSTIELDGRSSPLRGAAELDFRGLALRELFPTLQALREARGNVHGRARLSGTGNSVAALLGNANGRISLAVDRGAISQRVLELVGLDIAESVLLLATGDREVPLRCAVADLGVRGGIATSDVLVLDTDDTLVVGSGVVDLARERLDLTVYPRPKDASPLAARAPLHVRGPLRNPQVLPDAKSLTARGLTAALLALVNPLLALAPFIESGPGKDSDCAGLLARARDWSQEPRITRDQGPPRGRS